MNNIKQILCTIAGAAKAATAFIVATLAGYLQSEKESQQAYIQQMQQQQRTAYYVRISK